MSLSLKPNSRVSRDSSVIKLFVEYCFLDLPTVETPLSLPKPLPGQTIYYNYSNGGHAELIYPTRTILCSFMMFDHGVPVFMVNHCV